MNDVEGDEKCTSLYISKHCTCLQTLGFLFHWIYWLQALWGQGADQLVQNQKNWKGYKYHWGKRQTLRVISSDEAFLGLMQECMCLDGYIDHLHSKLV